MRPSITETGRRGEGFGQKDQALRDISGFVEKSFLRGARICIGLCVKNVCSRYFRSVLLYPIESCIFYDVFDFKKRACTLRCMGEERVTPASGLSSGEDPAEPVATDPIPVRLDEMARQIADLRSRLELHSELASTPPKESSYLLGTILDLKETIGRLDERIDNQGKMLSERIDNQGKMLSERIENQGKTLSDLSGHVVGLESKLDEQVWALRNVMLSKVQFWMGIGLLITVILGLAGIYLSTMPKP
jgi:hypothetical protein